MKKAKIFLLFLLISMITFAVKEVRPGEKPLLNDDFYTNVNYQYLKTAEIPKGYSETGNLSELELNAEKNLKEIIKNLQKNKNNLKSDSDDRKVVDFYNMALDFKTRDELGYKPIKKYLDQIEEAKNVKQLNTFMIDNFAKGYGFLYPIEVDQDQKNSEKMILYVGEPEFGLEKPYYENNGEYYKNIRKAYKQLIEEFFILSGYSKKIAKEKTTLVYNFQKEIAGIKAPKEQDSDFEAKYNVYTLTQLDKETDNLSYSKLFEKYGIKPEKIVVSEPKVLEFINKFFTNANLPTLKAYIEFQLIAQNSDLLSKNFLKARAKFSEAVNGVYDLRSNEDLAFDLTDAQLGELLGKLYVAQYFTSETKNSAISMVKEIINKYKTRINNSDWLSKNTKKEAIKKLDTMTIKIGYPDKWEDYSNFKIKDNLVNTIDEYSELETMKEIAKLNKAPDKNEWEMTPQTVNAYYNPLNNEIVFTAAILQAPLFSPKNSEEENLGGIGTVIGHEISHAFDDSGAQFDEKGNIKDWWTESDYEKFQKKVKKAADEFSKLEVYPGYFTNGDISTGEILADLGGITVAVNIAKDKSLNLDKLFRSYANTWRGVATKENLISGITDEHPNGKFRVNNIINQLDEYHDTYKTKPGDKMYVAPEDRLRVW